MFVHVWYMCEYVVFALLRMFLMFALFGHQESQGGPRNCIRNAPGMPGAAPGMHQDNTEAPRTGTKAAIGRLR